MIVDIWCTSYCINGGEQYWYVWQSRDDFALKLWSPEQDSDSDTYRRAIYIDGMMAGIALTDEGLAPSEVVAVAAENCYGAAIHIEAVDEVEIPWESSTDFRHEALLKMKETAMVRC